MPASHYPSPSQARHDNSESIGIEMRKTESFQKPGRIEERRHQLVAAFDRLEDAFSDLYAKIAPVLGEDFNARDAMADLNSDETESQLTRDLTDLIARARRIESGIRVTIDRVDL